MKFYQKCPQNTAKSCPVSADLVVLRHAVRSTGTKRFR
jgi:hypothetical protein